MIELEIGKAIVAVELETKAKGKCISCVVHHDILFCNRFCTPQYRKDGKNVIFKIVDYPPQTEGTK